MRPIVRRADCFARTQNGTFMPGLRRRLDDQGWVIVQPVNSQKRYSFPVEAILSLEDAWQFIRRRRVQTVLGSYVFESVLEAPRVIRCFNPQHPRRSNYVLAEGPRGWTCTCPAFARSRACKHLVARAELEKILSPVRREPAKEATLPLSFEPLLAA